MAAGASMVDAARISDFAAGNRCGRGRHGHGEADGSNSASDRLSA
jgi:hypothetical protein